MTDAYLTGANWLYRKTGRSYYIVCFSTLEKDHRLMVNCSATYEVGQPVWCQPAEEFFDDTRTARNTKEKQHDHR